MFSTIFPVISRIFSKIFLPRSFSFHALRKLWARFSTVRPTLERMPSMFCRIFMVFSWFHTSRKSLPMSFTSFQTSSSARFHASMTDLPSRSHASLMGRNSLSRTLFTFFAIAAIFFESADSSRLGVTVTSMLISPSFPKSISSSPGRRSSPFPVPYLLISSSGDRYPSRDFSASCAASDTSSSEPVIPSAVSTYLFPAPEPPEELFPKKDSVKDLKAFATCFSFPSRVLSICRRGLRTFISPCPMVALRLSICNFKILVWFAQLSCVRIKSPEAPDSFSVTN